MPIPTGTVSFSQIRTELNAGTGGSFPISGSMPLNDATFRSRLTDTAQNAGLSISSIRGNAYQRFTIAADQTYYDIYSALIATGWNGVGKGSADVIVNGGVTVSSGSTGSYALDTGGPWPAPSSLVLYNSGYIVGMGGAGGAGGLGSPGSLPPGTPGGGGGPGLRAQRALTLVNSGYVAGGGGGGGGGRGKFTPSATGANPTNQSVANGGGGGGGGRTSRVASAGGAAGGASGGQNQGGGQAGQPGSWSAAGAGGAGGHAAFNPGAPDGGAGGDWGTAGTAGQGTTPAPGGAAGISVQGWSVVTVPTLGTIVGPTAG